MSLFFILKLNCLVISSDKKQTQLLEIKSCAWYSANELYVITYKMKVKKKQIRFIKKLNILIHKL